MVPSPLLSRRPHSSARATHGGFTIVELLIVVVVIAILAAITIVAYNGIQNRAKQSAVQTGASQAAKKVALWSVNNNDTFPADKAAFLTAAGVADSADTTYDYLVSDDQKSYCVSMTKGGVSSSTTNTKAQTDGRCVANLVLNSGVESNSAGMGAIYGQGGVGTAVTSSASPHTGANMFRMTFTTAPTSTTSAGLWAFSNSATGLGAGGKAHTASAYVRPSWSGAIIKLNLVSYVAGGSNNSEVYGPDITLPANVWTRVSASLTPPANTDFFVVRVRHTGGALPPANATLDVDSFMLTEGNTLYSYGGFGSDAWQPRASGVNPVTFGPATY